MQEPNLSEPIVVLEQTPTGPLIHTFYNKIKIVKISEMEKELAKMEKERIVRKPVVEWDPQQVSSQKLYEYLLEVTAGEAYLIVEKETDNGYEAWRKLNMGFDAMGGQHDWDRYNNDQSASLALLIIWS